MSKFLRMIKNMSTVQKIVTLGASTVLVCGAVAGGVLLHNNSNEQAKTDTELYMEELLENADNMDSHDLRVALENVTDMDDKTREILEKKLEEKIAEEYGTEKEDETVASKPVEDKQEESKPSEGEKDESSNNNNTPDSKPSGGNSSNNSKPVEPTKPVEPSKPQEPSKPTEPTKPVEPPKPEKPSYPAKGVDKTVTDKFNARMLDQGFARDDSYTGTPAYTAIKNYALNRTPIPTDKIVHEYWGCKATGKVLTFTDTFKYTDDPAVWSESLTLGKLSQCCRNYQMIFANYAVCNSNGDGTFTVTIYTLDMTDL